MRIFQWNVSVHTRIHSIINLFPFWQVARNSIDDTKYTRKERTKILFLFVCCWRREISCESSEDCYYRARYPLSSLAYVSFAPSYCYCRCCRHWCGIRCEYNSITMQQTCLFAVAIHNIRSAADKPVTDQKKKKTNLQNNNDGNESFYKQAVYVFLFWSWRFSRTYIWYIRLNAIMDWLLLTLATRFELSLWCG